MAEPEHVEIVRKGAEAIAQWRKSHPVGRLDLSEANLAGADLREADLTEADLFMANLTEANLSEANLSRANLFKANLSRADLREADLTEANLFRANLTEANLSVADLPEADLFRANLTEANLTEANLSRAYLCVADLTEADLSEADLSGTNLLGAYFYRGDLAGANLADARCGLTTFGDCDLSRCRGLEGAVHKGPSTIGIDTLLRTARGCGDNFTPAVRTFFLGAGVPPEVLDAVPALVREVKYYSCFIAYGSPDKGFAQKLYTDLKEKGVSCWLFDTDARPGRGVWAEIGKARREADKVIITCSAESLKRDGLLKEIEAQADEDPDKLLPISLDDIWRAKGFLVKRGERDLKTYLEDQVYADFSGWEKDEEKYQQALGRLLTQGLLRSSEPQDRR